MQGALSLRELADALGVSKRAALKLAFGTRSFRSNRRAAMGGAGNLGEGLSQSPLSLIGGSQDLARTATGAESSYTASTISLPRTGKILGIRADISTSSGRVRITPNVGADIFAGTVKGTALKPTTIPVARILPGPVASIAVSTELDAAATVSLLAIYV